MKLNINRKKLRFGGVAVALTAFVIAAVVLLNVLFYALATNFRWYADMTSESLFTLSDEFKTLLNDAILGEGGVNADRAKYNSDNGLKPGDEDYKEDAQVTIYFCDDPDNLEAGYYMRYVYTTVLELAAEFDFIDLGYYNVVYKPSEVTKYQKMGYTINSNSIIVESGTEYRVFSLASMFVSDETENTYWAYNGEKKLAGAILAVTAAEQPVAYVTAKHSEGYFDTALLDLLQDAGYDIRIEGTEYLDAEGNTQTIPSLNDKKVNPLEDEDVRLVVVYNPRTDFQTEGVNELDRLNRFLEDNNSLMVFMGPTSPVLSSFEEWLADKWGVVFDRYSSETGDIYSYMINDTSASLDSAGYAIKADYVTSGGIGHSIYSNMLNKGMSPSVYFENAMSISFADHFVKTQHTNDSSDTSKDFWFGSSQVDGVNKNIFDVFTAGLSATAIANGTKVAEGSSESLGANSMFIFRDVDGKTYTVDNDTIIDADGNELFYNGNGNFVTEAGTELKISNGLIVTVGEVNGAGYENVITEIIEPNGSKYKLSNDGSVILDASGNVLESEVVDGITRYKTPAGSVLSIEKVAGESSIKIIESAKNTSDPFRLMTITQRSITTQETNYTTTTLDSYVLACGSLEFATEKYLSSAVYGNTDVLLSATTIMGRDVVPIGLDFKPFASFDISDITDAEANRYTLLLTIIPPVIIIGVGIVVLVRRKYS